MFTLSSVFFLLLSYLKFQSRLIFGIGGFLAGLLIPHDNGYSISIVEKLEDLVTIILLPLVRTCQKKHDIKVLIV